MLIRKANIKDIDAVNSIYNQAVEQGFCTAHLNPLTREEMLEWFRVHDPGKFPLFVAEEEKRPVGWISLSAYRMNRQALSHVAEVSSYVDRDFHRRGIGSLLLSHVIKQAEKFGFTVLIAILLSRNPASIALLRNFGFREWGKMPGIAIIKGESADHLYYGLKL